MKTEHSISVTPVAVIIDETTIPRTLWRACVVDGAIVRRSNSLISIKHFKQVNNTLLEIEVYKKGDKLFLRFNSIVLNWESVNDINAQLATIAKNR